ncbi:MAG: hypothetical protein HQL12_07725 [Candidatus Omnitrophica bacterium]|nr:hypothetical protein [Candidatus Omnitrophota bacterium]
MPGIFRKYGIFLFIPGIVLGFSILLKLAAGPYWLATNFDPSYLYLINGLHILKGIVLNDATHPGTPVQILCCVICWVFNIGNCAGDVVKHVLIAPEFYLNIVFGILSAFSFFTAFGLGLYVFRKTGDKLAAVLTQLPALSYLVMKSWETFEPVLPVVANVSPEPMLISVLNLFNICLFMVFFAKTPKEKVAAGLFWGFVCGFGTAVKLTFLPLLAVPLIVLSWENRIYFICVFMATFFVWTIPAIPLYPQEWGWVSGFITHGGRFQAEQAGGVDIRSFYLNGKNNIIEHWMFAGIFFAALFLVSWKFASKKWDKVSLFISAIILGILVQCLVVTQNPGAHYLLPSLGLFSPLLGLLYMLGLAQNALWRKITFVCILIFVFLGVWQARSYFLKLEGLTRDISVFHDHVCAKYQNCMFIDYYRSSDQQAALFFGDGWNRSLGLREDLFRLYPNKFFFNIWGKRIMSFSDRVWSNDLLLQNSRVLFRGDGNFDFSHSPFKVQLLEKGRFESIHLLTGTTEKQASILMAIAVQFYRAGEYGQARACALQARRLHYQPESSVESLIRFFGTCLLI